MKFGDESSQCLMIPVRQAVRRNGEKLLWLPEEATAVYARSMHLNSNLDVALSDVAYYHKGRREKGRGKFRWSLIEDSLKGVDFDVR